MSTYPEVNEKLGSKLQRKAGHHTYLVRNSGVPGDSIHLKFYDTYIITWYADGRIKLNSGGYRTVTTKARINEFIPSHWGISQAKNVWYLKEFLLGGETIRTFEFEDGIIIQPAHHDFPYDYDYATVIFPK